MSMARLKILFAIFILIAASQSTYAMIKEVPFPNLVHSSDLIVIADVEIIKTVGTMASDINVIANLVKVETPIKGETKTGDKLKIKTYGRIEDFPTFKTGSKLLLFLKKINDHYEVNHGIQGCWPIKNGIITGMGTGKTVEDIKTALNTPLPKPKKTNRKPIRF
jgi:hypothetical protein